MSDYRLAIKIAGELDGSLASAVNSAKSMLQGLTGKAGGAIGSALTGGATALVKGNAGVLAAIGATAGKIIKESMTEGMDFENAMSDLAGTSGIDIGSADYNKLETAIRKVGATTNKSATETAEAAKYFQLAGWSIDDTVDALDGAVKLSSATGLDMARTTDLVTDSMAALGLGIDKYGEYLDFVATADSAANYNAEQFMETMIRSGGAARSLSIGYKDLAIAAGVLANNGEKGSQAGTTLNSVLRRIATNETAVTTLTKNGIDLFDDATGEFRGLETVLKDINGAMESMTDEERISFLSDVAGRFTSQFQYLLDSVKEGGDWGKLLNSEFANVADNLEKRYKTATDNLKGDMDILKSAASDFGIEIYQSMVGGTEGLRSSVVSMTGIVGNLAEAFKTDGITGLATQIGNEIGGIADAISQNESGAIEAATAFVTSLYQSIGSPENSESIGSAAAQIITSLGTGFAETTGEFGVMAGNLISGLVDGLNDIDAGSQIADAISDAVSNIGDWFGENAGDLGAAAGSLIASLVTGIAEHADELIPAGIRIIGGLVQGLIQGAAKLVGAIPSILGNLVSGIANAIPALIDAGKGVGLALKEGAESVAIDLNEIFHFDNDYGELTEGAKEAFVASAEEMKAAIQEVWTGTTFAADEGINRYAAEGVDRAKDFVQAWVDAGATVDEVKAQVDAVREASNSSVQPDLAPMEQAEKIYGELANKAAEVVAANQEAAAAVQDTAAAVDEVGNSADTASEAVDTINGAMESLSGSDGLEGISSELDEMATGLEEAQGAADGLKESLTFDGFAGDLASDLLQADDIQARADEVSTAMQTIADNISTTMTNMQTQLSTVGTEIDTALTTAATGVSTFETTMTTMSTTVSTAFTDMSTAASTAMTELSSAVESEGAAAVSSAQNTANGIRAAFEGLDLTSVGTQIMQGLTNGIIAGGQAAVQAAQGIANQVAAAMSSALAIHSPSKVTYGIGEFTGEGFTNALTDAVPMAESAAESLANAGAAGLMSGQPMESEESPLARFKSMSYQGAGMAQGQQMQPQASGPITFSPTITIQGNADESKVQEALQWGLDQFEKMMGQYMWKKGRESFAT